VVVVLTGVVVVGVVVVLTGVVVVGVVGLRFRDAVCTAVDLVAAFATVLADFSAACARTWDFAALM
jgi:hypothetical protein